MSNILCFHRSRRLDADLTREQLLRRVRIVAHAHGCTDRQRASLERSASEHLALGLTPDRIVEKARSTARAMVACSSERVPA